MVLGFLLARAGIEVLVLEKHKDFLRDFRGDTIHPSTLELMYELGLLEDFLQRPHQELREIAAQVEDFEVTVADFSQLPTHCKFVGLMPQWDFLNFIVEKAKPYPHFHLRMEAGSYRSNRGQRSRRWRKCKNSGRRVGSSRGLDGGSGWPAFNCPRKGSARGL